jgi:hypothetical protein
MMKSSVQIDKPEILNAFFTILHDTGLDIHLLYVSTTAKLISTLYYTVHININY